ESLPPKHTAPATHPQAPPRPAPQPPPPRPLAALPRSPAEPVQASRARMGAEMLGDEVESIDGHIELIAVGVLEKQKVRVLVADAHRAQSEVLADAVVFVHHEVADRQVGEGCQRGAALVFRAPQRPSARA